MNEKITIKFYGIRGTAVAYGVKKTKFGTNTSCLGVKISDKNANVRNIVFDCGTGIAAFDEELKGEEQNCDDSTEKIIIDLFISHVHLDHIAGIAGLGFLFSKNFIVNIYSEERNGMNIKEQLSRLLSPPFWPVGVEDFLAEVNYITIKEGETVKINEDISLETLRANHSDVSTIFKLLWKNKKIVYALDYEHEEKSFVDLSDFAYNCDLLIYDASYSEEEYEFFKGWGHSTWEKGISMGQKSSAKSVALAHVNPNKTDDELFELQKQIQGKNGKTFFIPVEGEIIEL